MTLFFQFKRRLFISRETGVILNERAPEPAFFAACHSTCAVVFQPCSRLSPRATLTHLSCSPNFPRASITRYTHAKHEQILNFITEVQFSDFRNENGNENGLLHLIAAFFFSLMELTDALYFEHYAKVPIIIFQTWACTCLFCHAAG